MKFDLYVPVYSNWDLSLYELDYLISRPHDDRVLKVIKCESDLSFCPVREESEKPKDTCKNCQDLQSRNLKYLQAYSRYKSVEAINDCVTDEYPNLPAILSEAEIQNFTYSTLVTFRKSEVVSSSDPLYQRIRDTIMSSINLADKLIDQNCVEVILFNGRMARYWPFKIIGKDRLKDISITEAPLIGIKNMIITKKNYLHDQEGFSNELQEAFMRLSDTSALQRRLKKLANRWYAQRINTRSSNFSAAFNNRAYVTRKHTQPLNLPTLKEGQKLVSFFVSSPFDMANIKEKTMAFDGDQVAIIKALSEIKNIFLVVRIHPNMENNSDSFCERLQKQVTAPVKIIAANTKVNSYELIKASDIVVSAGSTVNAEAAFMGKQSVLCGSAPYARFGISLVVKDLDTLTSNLTHLEDEYWASTNPTLLKRRAVDYAVAMQAIGHRSNRIFRIFNRSVVFVQMKPVFSEFKIKLLGQLAKMLWSK